MAEQKATGDEQSLTGSEAPGTQRQGECLGLRWKPSNSAVDDSGTESGEDLRLLSPELLREVQSALCRLEGALPGLDPSRRGTVTQLVTRLQACLRIPPPSVPPIPPPRRFALRKAGRTRHTVGVTKEELDDARRWIAETDIHGQSSVNSLSPKEESIVSKVFRPVKFSPPAPVSAEKIVSIKPQYLQKHHLTRKTFHRPLLHRAGYFVEPASQLAAVSYVEPPVNPRYERSSSDTGSLLDYDPSLNLFTPEQSVQIAVHKAAIKKQISREGVKRRESSEDGDVSSGEEDLDPRRDSDVSSAQRLLQLASENPKKSSTPSRFHNKSTKKLKIKRANTIDIPKPATYYDRSSGDDYGGGSDDEGNNSDYITPGRKFSAEKKLPPPNFEPKTENDLKFLAFLKHANESSESKVMSYNPSARGGTHWSSRFSNIKNAFEGPEKVQTPPAAKLFWQVPQNEPAYKSKPSQPKLPWSVKTEKDGIVVGSITVAKRPPGPINQFTHAPKSAFKPVERKSQISPTAPPSTVKQIVSQKFSRDSSKPVLKQYLGEQDQFYPKVVTNQGGVPKHYPQPQNVPAVPNQTNKLPTFDRKQSVLVKNEPSIQQPPYHQFKSVPNKNVPESVQLSIASVPKPPAQQSYTANISAFQKPYPIGEVAKPQESAVSHSPVESYLKTHPKPSFYTSTHVTQSDFKNSQPVIDSEPEGRGEYLSQQPNGVVYDPNYAQQLPVNYLVSAAFNDQISPRISPSAHSPLLAVNSIPNHEELTVASDHAPGFYNYTALSPSDPVREAVVSYRNNVSPRPPETGSPQGDLPWPKPSPVECTEEIVAVSKVMGQAQCQKAVTVNDRTKRRYDSARRDDSIESELRLRVHQSARQKALSPVFPNVLQKSESWHQIVKEQTKQPPPPPPQHLPKISKAKSSHSLAFPKQFEASLTADKLPHKQSTVSQYMTPSPAKPKLKSQMSALLNSDDLDDVDQVFENIFQESNKKRNSK